MNHTTDPATTQATNWLAQLDHALTHSNLPAALALFADECYWHDLVAFTWNIVTLESRDAIWEMLATTLNEIQPSAWTLTEGTIEQEGVVEGWFFFETAGGDGVSCIAGWTSGRAFDAEHGTSGSLTTSWTSSSTLTSNTDWAIS